MYGLSIRVVKDMEGYKYNATGSVELPPQGSQRGLNRVMQFHGDKNKLRKQTKNWLLIRDSKACLSTVLIASWRHFSTCLWKIVSSRWIREPPKCGFEATYIN